MILYCCFKRGRRAKEIKVAQLSGYVSENTDYHHGEASLQGAIIGLAQNFPGSNNINLLAPNGNFGYRRQGGKDHASARYIYTQMEPITSTIFREEDEEVLTYNYADDKRVEPTSYAPIIPLILVNGAQGIGTGFSTYIPPHNPRDIVANLRRLINNDIQQDMLPWFNGFKGSIERKNGTDNKYTIKGKYTIEGNIVHIDDIPILNGWIEPYEFKMQSKEAVSRDDDSPLEKFNSHPGNNMIDMTLTFRKKGLQTLYKTGTLDKYLHMTQNMSITNLHLFNSDNKMTKYDYIEDIMYDFYNYRLSVYILRKEFFLKKLKNDLDIYRYKVMFIEEYLNNTILIARQKITQVIKQLEDKKYPKMANDHRVSEESKSYRYLTDMSIITLTEDKIRELKNKMNECQMIYDEYFNTPIKDIWNRELDEFLDAYDKWCINWKNENSINHKDTKKSSKRKKRVSKTSRVVGKN
jgi:DNA topoisomerase-2